MSVRRRAAGDHARFIVKQFTDVEPGVIAGYWFDPLLRERVNAECRQQGLVQPFPRVHVDEDPSQTAPLPMPYPRTR